MSVAADDCFARPGVAELTIVLATKQPPGWPVPSARITMAFMRLQMPRYAASADLSSEQLVVGPARG